MTQLHQAFKVDFDGIANVLSTEIKVAHPSLNVQFDYTKKFEPFIKAIWDTGATHSVIAQNVIEKLNLKPTTMTKIIGVSGLEVVDCYLVDFRLPNNWIIQNVQVTGASKINGTFDVLIGMDIIQRGDFSISNANGKTKFSFCMPSHENPTCLFDKTLKVNERLAKKSKNQINRANYNL